MSRRAPHRQLQRLLRRPPERGARDGRGRADRRADRRLPRRADVDDPAQGSAEGSDARLRAHLPAPARGGRGHLRASAASRSSSTPAGSTRPAAPRRRARSTSGSACARWSRTSRATTCCRQLAELQARGRAAHAPRQGHAAGALQAPVLSANAYLGGWGIAAALERGADLVICPRVTDAALVVGPAAWQFGWARDDWDRLAAGRRRRPHHRVRRAVHRRQLLASSSEVPRLEHPGFPIAEMHADGSFVITKHPGTGGLVSVGTVTAQLLYEIAGPRYLEPRRHRALRHHRARAGGPGPRAGAAACAASRRRRRRRSASTTSAATRTA